MDDSNEIARLRRSDVSAMQLSTDSVTAAGAASVESLSLETLDQAHQLARCIAAFTTDGSLADEMEEIVDESPAFLVSKVVSVRHGLEKFTGEHAALEEAVWKLVYAGRREKSRVLQVLARRRAL